LEKRGNRAEVRRERKKRDILSPVNVLFNLLISIYQKALLNAILFFEKNVLNQRNNSKLQK